MRQPNRFAHYLPNALIITGGILLGTLCILLAESASPGSAGGLVLQHIGAGMIAAAFIGLALDVFWSKTRSRLEHDQMKPILDRLENIARQLEKLDHRFVAFKHLGLNACYKSRIEALRNFLKYAEQFLHRTDAPESAHDDCRPGQRSTIDIVSSSARGLIGHVDNSANEVQQRWRNLLLEFPTRFRILLTDPAYAHLRQPAEERGCGDIELEIIKTATFLHCVAGMKSENLRFYRGSPTNFSISVENRYLLNPYPYGKMAMDTLCLEFESVEPISYVADFNEKHFDHTWEFIHQNEKQIDGKPMVVGVDDFNDILKAFGACTVLGSNGRRMRLTLAQVRGLDSFVELMKHRFPNAHMPDPSPFENYVTTMDLMTADNLDFDATSRAA